MEVNDDLGQMNQRLNDELKKLQDEKKFLTDQPFNKALKQFLSMRKKYK